LLKPYDVELSEAHASPLPVLMSKKPSTPRKQQTRKLFVLDTNVLMHDPTSLFRFDEHDLYLPIATLEELDAHKRGLSDVSRNARQASRFLDEIVSGSVEGHQERPGAAHEGRAALGRPALPPDRGDQRQPAAQPGGGQERQPDPRVVRHLQEKEPQREVVLVSKDINMRIKARALGLPAEDYFNDKVLEDADLCTPACGACRRTSGTATARTWSRGRRRATPTTGCAGRWCRSCT
jgi:PhoH-like ATPase